MEAFVWAATDSDLGVCISTRVFGSLVDAANDAQECIGDAYPVRWFLQDGTQIVNPDVLTGAEDELTGEWDAADSDGVVRIQKLKVRL